MLGKAFRIIISDRKNIFFCFLFSVLVISLFILLPVWTTPGNDVLFQLRLYKPPVFVLMVILALLNGYLLALHLHLHRHTQRGEPAKEIAEEAGILTTSIAATIGCAACYSSLLSLFGLGGTVFIVTHRWWFAAIAIGLSLWGIYHTSKRVAGTCPACMIHKQ
jgi:hypothetical protein